MLRGRSFIHYSVAIQHDESRLSDCRDEGNLLLFVLLARLLQSYPAGVVSEGESREISQSNRDLGEFQSK